MHEEESSLDIIEEQFFPAFSELQEVLEVMMTDFDDYDLKEVQDKVAQINQLIDTYLGIMAYRFPRYDYFSLNEDTYQYTGLAYLESIDAVNPNAETARKLHELDLALKSGKLTYSQLLTSDESYVLEHITSLLELRNSIQTLELPESLVALMPTQYPVNLHFGMLHFGFSCQLDDDIGIIMMRDENREHVSYQHFSPKTQDYNELFLQLRIMQASQMNIGVIISFYNYFNLFDLNQATVYDVHTN